MDAHPAPSAGTEAQLSPASAAVPCPLHEIATIWADLFGFWTGQRAAGTDAFPIVATVMGGAEAATRACHTVLEANQTVTKVIYMAAQRQQAAACSTVWCQQDLVFTAARATLSGLERATAWADGAPRRALAVYGETCGRAIDAARMLGADRLAAQRGAPTIAKGQTEVAERP